MGGCQNASDNVQAPRQASFLTQNKFKKLEKYKFTIPQSLKLQIVLSGDKITNYITKTKTPIQFRYKNLDIGSNLGKDNKFVDSQFKANSQKLIQEHRQQVQWKRPSSFMSHKHSVFEGKIQPLDIKQGKLGNCYFLSAITAMSQYPFIIKRIFQATQTTIYGAYGVWLFIDGFWQCIVVDDRFPTKKNKPIYSKNNGNQLWVMLLQKAYAKVFGSYHAIQSGLTGIGMNSLTGAPYQYLCKDSSSKTGINSTWQFIIKNLEKQYMLTGSTESNDRNKHMGIISTHSYTIIDAKQVEVLNKAKKKKKQKIIKLSNPWGRYEWKGRWSQYSDVWNQQLKQQLKFVKADDGIFWIGLQDYIQNFGQICVCKYNKNYISTSLPLTFDTQKQNDFKGIFLTINNKTQGYLNLIQQDHRFHPNTDYQYSLVRIIVLQIDKNTSHLHQYINDMMDCDHDASMQLQLDQGQYYIIVEVDWKTNYTRDMVLNFYGQQSVSLIQDKKQLKLQKLFNQIVFLHQNHTEQQRIYEYQKDTNIKRITGFIAGYVYYHYSNQSKNNNGLCQAVTLKDNQNIQVYNQQKKDDFVVKLAPGQQRIVTLKVKKQGNSHYSFSTKIQFYIIQRYSLQRLRQLTDRKPTKVKKRQIDDQQIDVIVKTYNYTGGVAVLYQNKMEKYTYVQDITFQIQNLQLQNQQLTKSKNKKLQIQLQPQSQKLLSFIVSRPGKQIVFKTKISFYLNSPQFKF